jgi:hypothetical protein
MEQKEFPGFVELCRHGATVPTPIPATSGKVVPKKGRAEKGCDRLNMTAAAVVCVMVSGPPGDLSKRRRPVPRTSGHVRRLFSVASLGTAAILGLAACSTSTPAATKAIGATSATGATNTFLASLHKATQIGSTVPPDGDINPYGIAVVPTTTGSLVQGSTLVSNFNDKANTQGTGTTIVEVSPTGTLSTFAQITDLPAALPCPGGIGLTTGLAVLPGGWVVIGSLPAGPGGSLPAPNPAGCLIVLNSAGAPVETWTNADINGPWDMTVATTPSGAALFVSNVLSRPADVMATPPSGLCTVVRIDVTLSTGNLPTMTGATVVGRGFPWRASKAAFIQGPTGVALGGNGTLYVAETLGSEITAIPGAMTRTSPVTQGTHTLTAGGSLNGPLGLALAPDGDLIAVNGNDGRAVEITTQGTQITTVTLVAHGAGDLFGLTPTASGDGLLFVNDGTNALDVAEVH